LHLETGTLITLIPSDDWFPGNEIRFSPINDYYAIDKDGVRITNFISGKETKIDVSGVMEMSWSPDGKFLAFSVASCGETFVESSSILVWNSSTNQTQVLFSTKEMLLRPQSWIDNDKLRFEGETWVGNNNAYTIFEYNLTGSEMIFSGTATPRP
jgi:Tol biopolymer transport system component